MAREEEEGAGDILFLDAYDSFTYNIVSLLACALPLAPSARIVVHSLHDTVEGHDAPLARVSDEAFAAYLRGFSAVVCGPGPGHPLNPDHVGPFTRLWDLPDRDLLPVLGICLGFQSLVARFGARIRKLGLGQHGIVRDIAHQPDDDSADNIFHRVPAFRATLYHSLCADVGQDDVPERDWPAARWAPFAAAPDLAPLAWTTVDRGAQQQRAERVLMAAKHVAKPFWGLQYHPESICTEAAGVEVLRNWFREATAWSERHGRRSHRARARDVTTTLGRGALPTAIQTRVRAFLEARADDGPVVFADDWLRCHRPDLAFGAVRAHEYVVATLDVPPGFDAARIREVVDGDGGGERASHIMLDASSARVHDPLAKQSIIAVGVDDALRFEHVARPDGPVTMLVPGRDGAAPQRVTLETTADIKAWDVISQFWSVRRRAPESFAGGSPSHALFRAGFMGYLSYEMGLETVSPALTRTGRADAHADMCLAWITRSIVIDHQAGQLHIQALGVPGDVRPWLARTQGLVAGELARHARGQASGDADAGPRTGGGGGGGGGPSGPLMIKTPDPRAYEDKVRRCQREIAEGNSYELCLTQQTIMTRPGHRARQSTAWDMYKTLRARQPAPFGSFVALGGATLLSCSPERFLRHDARGRCSMRPMKGTVRKSAAVAGMADAERMLRVPKEMAENLMIVDLVRHDLHRVCGYGQVTVPEPFKIEEYATVFTMVTGVDGQLNRHLGVVEGEAAEQQQQKQQPPAEAPMTGLDVLRSVFPPGSMTGAPKKRSCELLAEIEDGQPRGLYSGVVGYMDVTGAGDWSVTIRSLFRYDDETAAPEAGETEPREVWHIGAGGAVTILSTPEGEREEMFTKLEGPLGVFRDVA